MPWMLAAIAIPSLVQVGLSLWGSHKSEEAQKQAQAQGAQSNAEYMKMMAPYMQSSKQQMDSAQAMAFGMAGQSGVNTSEIFRQLQAGQTPGQPAGGPQGRGGPGPYPPGITPGYDQQQQEQG